MLKIIIDYPEDNVLLFLQQVYERLDELGADVAEAKASHLLHGLGFTKQMMAKKCKDFSGNISPSFSVQIWL